MIAAVRRFNERETDFISLVVIALTIVLTVLFIFMAVNISADPEGDGYRPPRIRARRAQVRLLRDGLSTGGRDLPPMRSRYRCLGPPGRQMVDQVPRRGVDLLEVGGVEACGCNTRAADG